MGGALASRRNADVEEVDISTHNAYRYPPKSGCYFGSHFIMGGERFETTQPETYLFGENQDLNFLGHRPIPFPYPAPQAHEPTKTLKSLVNIRKDSLRLIRVLPEDGEEETADPEDSNPRYNLEFTFDTDVRVAISIYYFATEEITNGQAIYHPRDATMNSETFHYKRGANQTFSQSTHIIVPGKFPEEEWQYNPDKEIFPVVIQCVVEDEVEHEGHSHMTFGIVEKSLDGGYSMKALKQKQIVDGLCYLLQEIYGIENKSTERSKLIDEEIDDTGSECVICMCETRDTLILPCRHLCLCNTCADNLRYQANNCPICRAPFRALLQIRAMRKKLPSLPQPAVQPQQQQQTDSSDENISQEGVPAGYEAVSLIKALNGSSSSSSAVTANPLMPPLDVVVRTGTPTSLPTSTEVSPILSKKKSRRQSSNRSQRSAQLQETVVEEAREARDLHEVTAKPADGPEPGSQKASPESPRKKSFPKMRYPAATTPLSCETDRDSITAAPDSLQILNEQETGDKQSNKQHVRAASVTPPPDYESACDQDEMPTEDAEVKAAAPASGHTVVVCGGPEGRCESEPVAADPLSLPGTPCNTDQSSYGSNSSSKALLSTSPRQSQEDQPML